VTNPDGHPETLVAAHSGNRNAERSSVYAVRDIALDPEVQTLAESIMAAPHVEPMDELAAVEIARLMVLIERIDADLAKRGMVKRKSTEPRGMLDLRRRYSGQLERWLSAFGMTPASRAEVLRNIATASGGLGAEIARRRAEAQSGEAA
jgi:hypothetical protein